MLMKKRSGLRFLMASARCQCRLCERNIFVDSKHYTQNNETEADSVSSAGRNRRKGKTSDNEALENGYSSEKPSEGTSNSWNVILHRKDKVREGTIGYLIADTFVSGYRHSEGFYLFRVDQRFEFTSGNSAVESGFDKNWVGEGAEMSIYLTGHTIQNHYGSFTSPTPQRINYWPKNSPVYKTITSGIDSNLTWGRTQSVSGGFNGDQFGAQASSAFESSFGIGFHYSETYQESYPTIDAKELSEQEGIGIKGTRFSGKKITERSVSLTCGMLLETKIPSSDGFEVLAELHTSADYHIHAYLSHKTISYNQSFALKL